MSDQQPENFPTQRSRSFLRSFLDVRGTYFPLLSFFDRSGTGYNAYRNIKANRLDRLKKLPSVSEEKKESYLDFVNNLQHSSLNLYNCIWIFLLFKIGLVATMFGGFNTVCLVFIGEEIPVIIGLMFMMGPPMVCFGLWALWKMVSLFLYEFYAFQTNYLQCMQTIGALPTDVSASTDVDSHEKDD